MRRTAGTVALGWLSALVAMSCRAPTEITVDVSTDISCADLRGTALTVGKVNALESTPSALMTSACDDASHGVGSVVLVPRGANNDEVAFKVVAGFGRPVEDCLKTFGPGCIVARRAMRYLPHTPLLVPVLLSSDCDGIACSDTETCAHGKCVAAQVDALACAAPGGCLEADGGAAVDAASDAASDAGSDAASDAGPQPHTVGGSIANLLGRGLTLASGPDVLQVPAKATSFQFATALTVGQAYDASVTVQPKNPWQTCVLANGRGTVGASDVKDLTVTCATNPYAIRGAILGLTGGGLELQDNGGDTLIVPPNATSYQFATKLPSGAAYQVTVSRLPDVPQSCVAYDAQGTVGGTDVPVNVVCAPFASCRAILGAYPSASSGQYFIDVDGRGPIVPFTAYCDMTFNDGTQAGGWTLIIATVPPGVPDTLTAGVVLPGASGYMPTATMQALAASSTQVHLRSPGDAANRSITSRPGSSPVRNLLAGRRANDPIDPGGYLAPWTGPMATNGVLFSNCGSGHPYPSFYWACNSGNGLHLIALDSRWAYTAPTNEPLEVYMR